MTGSFVRWKELRTEIVKTKKIRLQIRNNLKNDKILNNVEILKTLKIYTKLFLPNKNKIIKIKKNKKI